jgi:hypothetical protein
MNPLVDQNPISAKEKEDDTKAALTENKIPQVLDESLPNVSTNMPACDDSLSGKRVNKLAVPSPLKIGCNDVSPMRASSGPRSKSGKKRSSQNAIKFGIFSRATLLSGESRSEYEALLDGLWKSWEPKGVQEEVFVEKLTSLSWRYRRLLVADGPAFQKTSECEDPLIKSLSDSGGLDRLIRYETSLERAFDRTLTQLERVQRMRKGQPLPPQLEVKIS